MMNTKAMQSPPAWNYLETFELRATSPTNKLYRNGRQQVQVTIYIRPTDIDGNVATLTDAQRASVHLIDYDTGQELPAVPDSGRVTDGWAVTRRRNEFEYFPGSRDADNGSGTPGVERF